MANTRMRRIASVCTLVLSFWCSTSHAQENDPLLATVDKPAVITATRRASTATIGRSEVIVGISRYHPSADGSPIEVVVDGRVEGGPDREIGRFGVTPDREFVADDPSDAQRFRFALPPDFAARAGAGKALTFIVRLVAVRGSGKGASLRVGDVELP
ncbi:hypothetical protein ACNJYC_07950 [Bradyrhizobium sp. DASA03007]|uniref:hypothetical protein n=2 Tax=unclassified Bradyrhizobium TaxID=2631580 RepID=UPI003F715E68